jgi:hypothetical protein
MSYKNDLADGMFDNAATSRRTALKQVAALLGLTLSAQALEVLAAAPEHVRPHGLKLLSREEWQMTGVIAELIIPATDTPGALAADVHGFIDHYLAECVGKQEQQEFANGLNTINTIAQKQFHKMFLSCRHAQQVQLLTAIEKTALGFTTADNAFFKFFKSLTLLGYYTSEPGATRELAYLPIPGGYQGNFPFVKIGKAWALN